MQPLLYARRELQNVSLDVLAAAVSAVKPWARSLCQPPAAKQATSSFKRRGRNARKQKGRFFVFPELAAENHVSTSRKVQSTTAIITTLLQDLRVPNVVLPVRYFLEADRKRSQVVCGDADAGCTSTKDPKWVSAVPDTRGIHKTATTRTNSPATMQSQAATVDSLRSLVTLMEFGSESLKQDPGFVASAFSSIDRMVRAAAAAQYARFPRSLSAALPHVSAAAQWQGKEPQGADAARSAQLLPETALRVAQQYLLPALDSSRTLEQLSTSQMADIAAALAVLQKQASDTLAPAFWQHLQTCAEQEHHSLLKPSCMGVSSRISSVVQQAGGVLPPAAHTTAALLHASRTWLQPSESQATSATIPTLSPANTIWCFLAMHTPYRSVQPTAGIRQPHGSRTSPNAKPLGVPWDWIRSSRVAVARTRYSNNKSTIQALLRQRIKKMTPSDHIHWQATAFSTRGNTISAMHPQPMHVPPASELRWPEHAPVLLAGLSMPIAHSMQRSALRPLLAASAACIAQSPPGATQTGHWVALLDLTSSSLAAMSQKHHSTAEALVATACEELQAQVSVLSAHHVTSSVLLLGEILTKQGRWNNITCDAAYQYLSSIFRCDAVIEMELSAPELLMMSSGIQRLCGASTNHIWCGQQQRHLQRAGSGSTSKDASGFGRPLTVPNLQPFSRKLANQALKHVTEPSLETAEATRSMLNMLGAVRLRYQQVVPFLRRCTAVLHDHLKISKGADHSTKALAHVLLALGELQVPFDTVYPLVLAVCDILHDRTPSMDATEVYLIVDGLVKLHAPTPEAAPLLLAMMAHLSEGLDIRPTKPALHMNILTTPPSQLLKLAHGIKSFMPQTHGMLTREMQAAPKAAFMRSLLSHIMRLRLADLTHRDLLHVLQLVKDSSLGRDLPKPWTQDSALRILDRLNAHLFNGTVKDVPDTMYWQGQPLLDLMYTGIGAPPPLSLEHSTSTSSVSTFSLSSDGQFRQFPALMSSSSHTAAPSVALQSGERRLVSDDLLLGDSSDPSVLSSLSSVLVPQSFSTDVKLLDPELDSGSQENMRDWDTDTNSFQNSLEAPPEERLELTERWAYRKVYSIVQDSTTVILGSLRALDWDAQVTHAVKTLTDNIGPRGLHAPSTLLDSTLPTSTVTVQRWRQIQYTGQDRPPGDVFDSVHSRGRGRGRGRGERGGRGGRRGQRADRDSEFRKRQLAPLETPEFVLRTVPDIESLDLSKTSTASQLLCGFRPVDCSRLLVAVAELYPDSASSGRNLMHELGPSLFTKFPPEKHHVPDLARMIWALGVLARPGCGLQRALPALYAALGRCEDNMTTLHPKFAMLAAKGLALMARGGMMVRGEGSTAGELWPALTQLEREHADKEHISEDEQSLSHLQKGAEQARDLTDAARSYVSNVLAHFASPASVQGGPIALKLRPEGLAETLTAATLLGDPAQIQQLQDVWRIAVGALEAHERPQDVPLRATRGLLSTAIHLLQANNESSSSTVEDPTENGSTGTDWGKQQQRLQATMQQHHLQQYKLLQEVSERVSVITLVARERLLHHKRRPTPLQVRTFSTTLLTLAREGVPVKDAGLVQALVALAVSAPAIMNAKQRGTAGATRLVQHLEDLAALESHGVVFCGSERGGRREGGAEVIIDASLSQCMVALREGVESAVGRDDTRVLDSLNASSHVHGAQGVHTEEAIDSAVSSDQLSSGANEEGDRLSTLPGSNDLAEVCSEAEGVVALGDAHSKGSIGVASVSPWEFAMESGDKAGGTVGEEEWKEGDGQPDEAEADAKIDETLQALVDSKEWRQGAWDRELAARLNAALDTLSGGG